MWATLKSKIKRLKLLKLKEKLYQTQNVNCQTQVILHLTEWHFKGHYKSTFRFEKVHLLEIHSLKPQENNILICQSVYLYQQYTCFNIAIYLVTYSRVTGSSTVSLWLWHSIRARLMRIRASAVKPEETKQKDTYRPRSNITDVNNGSLLDFMVRV